MLTILQYLALIAAFFLPWSIGSIVKFHKDGSTRARKLCVIALIVCAVVVTATIALAFMITPV